MNRGWRNELGQALQRPLRHVGSLRSRRWGRYPEKTYEDYRREEAEERQRKINAVLSEIREKFGEGVMRLGSDFLKDEDEKK